MTQQDDKEQFICLNCYAVGSLTDSLRCSSCGSDAVASTESVKAVTPRTEARMEQSRPAHTHRRTDVWYHFTCNGFETVVSYLKASSKAEALEYAKSKLCEWYMTDRLPECNGYMVVKALDHTQYNEWCRKMWPITATEQS